MRLVKHQIEKYRRALASTESISSIISQYLFKKGVEKKPEKIVFKKMTYPQLDRFFIRYVNSMPFEGRVHGKSLALVIGAKDSGKSQYIQKNLQQMRRLKFNAKSEFSNKFRYPEFNLMTSPESHQNRIQQSIVQNPYSIFITLNFKEMGGDLNYTGFIETLHEQVIDKIMLAVKQFYQQQKISNKQSQNKLQTLLTAKLIKQIALSEYAPQYVLIYIKDVIYAILEDSDMIQLSQEKKQRLEEFNQRITGKKCQDFFEQSYSQLIDIIKNDSELQQSAAIRFFYSVFARIQYEYRPQQYTNSWYQSGIQTTDFLFAILNFLNGVGKYTQNIEKEYYKASSQEQRVKIRKQLQESDNHILKGGYYDIMLVLMNLQNLTCFQNKNEQFLNFYDHLICRTVQHSNFRKHFPIMIELPNRQFLDQTLQLGKTEGSNPVVIEIPGYTKFLFDSSNLIEVFDRKLLQKQFWNLGRNPHTWNNAIRYITKEGGTMEQLAQGKAPFQVKQQITARSRINKVFINEHCREILNNDTIDIEIVKNLRFLRIAKGLMMVLSPGVATLIFRKPVFQALLQQGILYHNYYMPFIQYSNLPDKIIYLKYQKQLKKQRGFLKFAIMNRKLKQYTFVKRDYTYTIKKQHMMTERLSWGKFHVDQEFDITYYGHQMNYVLGYQHNAHAKTPA